MVLLIKFIEVIFFSNIILLTFVSAKIKDPSFKTKKSLDKYCKQTVFMQIKYLR